jgi:U3 small nucleolar RNA-associated protein 25
LPEPEPESSEEEEITSDESLSDEDMDEVPIVRPYAALIQSLAVESGPRTKRRKLGHVHHGEDMKFKEGASDDAGLEREDTDDADEIEEDEEGPETATDGLLQDDEDLEDASDPFESHFAGPDDNILSQRLQSLQNSKWNTKKLVFSIDGKVVFSVPEPLDSRTSVAPSPISSPEELKLKQKLSGAFAKQCATFDKLEGSIAPFIFNYQDVLFCGRHPGNAESLRRLMSLHAVNHIFKLVYHC